MLIKISSDRTVCTLWTFPDTVKQCPNIPSCPSIPNVQMRVPTRRNEANCIFRTYLPVSGPCRVCSEPIQLRESDSKITRNKQFLWLFKWISAAYQRPENRKVRTMSGRGQQRNSHGQLHEHACGTQSVAHEFGHHRGAQHNRQLDGMSYST